MIYLAHPLLFDHSRGTALTGRFGFTIFVNIAIFSRTCSTLGFGTGFNGSHGAQQFIRINTVSNQHFTVLLQLTRTLFNFCRGSVFFFTALVNDDF